MDQRTAKQNPATSGPGLSTVSNALAGGAYVFNSTTGAPSAQEATLQSLAKHYHGLGLNVIPTADDKRPPETAPDIRLSWGKWKETRQTADDLAGLPWDRASNLPLGLVTGLAAICGPISGALVCIDFDGGQDLGPVRAVLGALGLPAAYGWAVQTPSGGFHVWTRCPGLELPDGKGKVDRPGRGGFAHVELRYTGHYALLPPSFGGRYSCLAGNLPELAPAEVTPAALLAAYDLVTDAAPTVAKSTASAPAATRTTAPAGRYTAYAQAALDKELDTLAKTHEGQRNDQLNRAAFSLGQLVGAGLLDRADVESQLSATALAIGLDDRETLATMRSGLDAGAQTPRQVDPGRPAAASSHSPEHDHGAPGSNGTDPARPVVVPDLENREDLTDLGNARRLVRLYGHDLRYVEAWGWLAWDGKRWSKDETGQVMRLAKRVALGFYQDAAAHLERAAEATRQAEAASAAGNEEAAKAAKERADKSTKLAKVLSDHAKKCQARSQLENMVKLAASEKGIVARPEDFDRNPWLLNVANGMIDLRTGALLSHDRGALCTMLAPVDYDPRGTCPRWLAFLERIFAGDSEVTGFVQRMIGYSLTGSTRDHVLPFCHGAGANGKGTLTNTVLAMLGDYGQKARRSLVTLGKGSDDAGPTPDKARLKGARFVVVNETEEGRRLAESDVKDLTGGDRIAASFKYKDTFEFDPTHKLWLYGNHRPEIRGTDEGIWRRVKYIPFEVVIPEKERDPILLEKLAEELPGILAWAVAGCLDWQRAGLRDPEKVRQATKAYREESDVLAAFIGECFIEGEHYETTATDFHDLYKTWCKENGEREQAMRRLAPRLRERGYTDTAPNGKKLRDSKTGRNVWRGLARRDQPTQEALLSASSEPSEPSEPFPRKVNIVENAKPGIEKLPDKGSKHSEGSELLYEEGEL